MGLELATITSDLDNMAAIDAAAAGRDGTWIGLTDATSEGWWRWSDGSLSAYRAWRPGEPNGGTGENCAELSTGGWYDVSCTNQQPYLCSESSVPYAPRAPPPSWSPSSASPPILDQFESIVASTPGAGWLAFAIVATVLGVCLACCGLAVALRRNRAHMRELATEVASLREARRPVRVLAFGRGQRTPGERAGLITKTSSSSSSGGRERQRQVLSHVLASRRRPRQAQRHTLDLEGDDEL